MKDRVNYPALFWVYVAMSVLLIGTFGFFWLHSLLWMFRGFIENREKKRALAAGAQQHKIDNPHKIYRRFKPNPYRYAPDGHLQLPVVVADRAAIEVC